MIRKSWVDKAYALLQHSLGPISSELNELDWKLTLSPNTEQLRKHVSAFSNLYGGGFLAFGVGADGTVVGVEAKEIIDGILLSIGNLARDGVEPAVQIDHWVFQFRDKTILLVYIKENQDKPVHLRGKGLEASYIRSAGQSRIMSKHELAQALISARPIRFEELPCFTSESQEEILSKLEVEAFFKLLQKPIPTSSEGVLDELVSQKIITKNGTNFSITNLGVITCAKDMAQFSGHERRGVRVVVYEGTARLEGIRERVGKRGYAVGFQGLVRHIMDSLPGSEVIKEALRKSVSLYPEIAIRELVANAIAHQDLAIQTISPMVEIFRDRMEITSPGRLLPTIPVERIIDSSEPRNESFARLLRSLGICEERGGGIDKALTSIELYGLPPLRFKEGENNFKVTIFAPKKYKDMTQEERIQACYQHCVLKYVANQKMTNATLRNRFGISEDNYPMVSKVIKDAIAAAIIKKSPEATGKRDARYIPHWA